MLCRALFQAWILKALRVHWVVRLIWAQMNYNNRLKGIFMKTHIFVLTLIVVMSFGLSSATQVQTINQYHFPFNSKDNSIELTVENGSDFAATGLIVSFPGSPRWLHFTSPAGSITLLKPKSDQTVKYSIVVDKLAPV